MTVLGIHQPQYLPWLGLIERINRCDVFVVLDNVPYSKNYFYNRNRIKTANGTAWLTVPVLTKGKGGQTFTETRINNSQRWGIKQWKSIYYSYNNAPHFHEYGEYFRINLEKRWDFLVDLCLETLHTLLRFFNITTEIRRASELEVDGKKEELLLNICETVGATSYLSGPDGKNYLTPGLWADNQIVLDFQQYKHPVYPQQFDSFISNLSAIDLLFNCGGESLEILTYGQPNYFGGTV